MEYNDLFMNQDLSSAEKVSWYVVRVANAFQDLLARAEAAEARVRELETSFRTEKCENGPECVELGKVRKALSAAEARAEKAERERDEYREMIHRARPCSLCEKYDGSRKAECIKCASSVEEHNPTFKLKEE